MCTYLQSRPSGYYFRRRIPAELRPFLDGQTEFSFPLGTKEREEAKRLIPHHTIASDKLLSAAKAALAAMDAPAKFSQPPAPFDPFAAMTEKQFEDWQEQQAEASRLASAEEDRREQAEAYAAALPADHPAAILLREAQEDLGDYRGRYRRRKRRDTIAAAAGNSLDAKSPLPLSSQPNSRSGSQETPQGNSAAVTLTGLFAAYAGKGNLSPAIVKEWTTKVQKFVAFLGHDDAAPVTTENIRDWRNHIRDEISETGKRRSAQTVNSGYLAPIRSAFKHGVDEGLIRHDPAKDVARVTPAKVAKIRDKDFTEAEQRVILAAASAVDTSGQPSYLALVRRWVPWLCAYSGARVNEITQLRAEDVMQIDGHWVLNITPEAGRVKTNANRYVPVHEHLIAQGFLAVVEAQKTGPIFYDPDKGNPDSERGQYKKAGERLAAWVRSLGITDPGIKPNHGWRHLFKTVANHVGMQERAADYMQGHASQGVGRSYGRSTIGSLVEQMALIPRFDID